MWWVDHWNNTQRRANHSGSFLEGPKAALVASKDFKDGHYHEPPQHGIRAFARVYSAWAYGQTVRSFLPVVIDILNLLLFQWFREHKYRWDGLWVFNQVNIYLNIFFTNPFVHRYPDLETFIRERWEDRFLNNWYANDLITLLHTWQNGDVSQIRDGGDLQACLNKIKAKGLIMPSKTDLYFPV
jgi:homoserine O-acetyltransferase